MSELDNGASTFGSLAVRLGYATKKEVFDAMEEQEAVLPLGEIMVSRGSLTLDQLEHILHVQGVEQEDSLRAKTHLQLAFQTKKAREVVVSLRSTTMAMRAFIENGKLVGDSGS